MVASTKVVRLNNFRHREASRLRSFGLTQNTTDPSFFLELGSGDPGISEAIRSYVIESITWSYDADLTFGTELIFVRDSDGTPLFCYRLSAGTVRMAVDDDVPIDVTPVELGMMSMYRAIERTETTGTFNLIKEVVMTRLRKITTALGYNMVFET